MSLKLRRSRPLRKVSPVSPVPKPDKSQPIPIEKGYQSYQKKFQRGQITPLSATKRPALPAALFATSSDNDFDDCSSIISGLSKLSVDIDSQERAKFQAQTSTSAAQHVRHSHFRKRRKISESGEALPLGKPPRSTSPSEMETDSSSSAPSNEAPFDKAPGGLINPRKFKRTRNRKSSGHFSIEESNDGDETESMKSTTSTTFYSCRSEFTTKSERFTKPTTPERWRALRPKSRSDPTGSGPSAPHFKTKISWKSESNAELTKNWRQKDSQPTLNCLDCRTTIVPNCSKLTSKVSLAVQDATAKNIRHFQHIMIKYSDINPRKVKRVTRAVDYYTPNEMPNGLLLQQTDFKMACQKCDNHFGRIYTEKKSKDEFVFFRHSYRQGVSHLPGLYVSVNGKEENLDYFKILSGQSQD